ncbi:hypothetical protein DYI37_03080 [Fulvimarina endophytica]|uniref:DUF1833 domain-containing protein n=1 Tax=Fulvimarina endophytica TaxID=2293836 RepID=A0A371XB75_9HYPH|nr:hypothetical protein [Fulvimarina endophytica]RFC66441.1 hypothetical protein DYI37_03080 [Fulvimarina endophytica]
MRIVSLNARRSLAEPYSDEHEVVLVHITHPALTVPIRLSTDPTETLSYDPLRYGTRSAWMTGDGSPFLFILAGVEMPEDADDAPPAARISITATDSDLARTLRTVRDRAKVSIAVVYAGDPNDVIMEYRDFDLIGAEGDVSTITLSLQTDALAELPWPYPRMTKQRFAALFR